MRVTDHLELEDLAARGVVRRVVKREPLPEGFRVGIQIPDGPLLYIADRPAPGGIILRRWTFREGPTLFSKVGAPIRQAHSSEIDPRSLTTDQQRRLPSAEPGVEKRPQFWRTNPFEGQSGWTLYAMGTKAWMERGLTGTDDAAALRYWYKRIPVEERIGLPPNWFLPKTKGPNDKLVRDPLSSPDERWRPWVSDRAITSLIRAASKGAPGIQPLKFAVPPEQDARSGGHAFKIQPMSILRNLFSEGETVEVQRQQGLTLREAVKVLRGTDAAYQSWINKKPELLYEAWRSQVMSATPAQQQILNLAYHRILLWRFLQKRRLTPNSYPPELERHAQLIQAYRVFVFNRMGCPVGLNTRLLKLNGVDVSSLQNRNIPYASYLRFSDAKAHKWGEWLYSRVLNKASVECRAYQAPIEIDGLSELLAHAEAMR